MPITPKAFAKDMELSVLSDGHAADRPSIATMELNRPGLQFAGFFDVFASERIQLVGLAETTYLSGLDRQTAAARMRRFFSEPVPCVVIARGLPCPEVLLSSAEASGVPVYGTGMRTSDFAAGAILYLSEALAPRTSVHGVLMDVYGQGVLIEGESGIGKSECALELLRHGHQLVADDAVLVSRVGGKLFGEAPEMVRDLLELRGVGIVDVKKIFGIGAVVQRKRIDLVIRIEPWSDLKAYDRLGSMDQTLPLLDVALPLIEIPVRPGRSLANIVEIAARNYSLRREGYIAAEELDRRLRSRYAREAQDEEP